MQLAFTLTDAVRFLPSATSRAHLYDRPVSGPARDNSARHVSTPLVGRRLESGCLRLRRQNCFISMNFSNHSMLYLQNISLAKTILN
jgi:hypothetical protein